MLYYLDLEQTGTGRAGTELDPWSYANYMVARIFPLVIGDTCKLKGYSIQSARPEVDSVAKGFILCSKKMRL